MKSNKQPNVLCIDDDTEFVSLVQKSLLSLDCNVCGLSDGTRAVTQMQEEPPDLVLLDLAMPEFNGYDIYRAMKEDEALAKIPVIVISAYGFINDIHIISGLPPVEAFITKPFDISRLRQMINEILTL